MIPFFLFMSTNLITEDVQLAGYGYVIGHFFLYIGLAVYVYAPFQMIIPDKKRIPNILAFIMGVGGIIITYINWMAYASKEYLPKYDNGVTIWQPPQTVFIFIAISTIILWVVLGTFIFWYHALQTNNKSLRKRSFRIGLGLLILAIGGPLHDTPLPGATILLADAVVAIGLIIIAWGLLTSVKRQE